MFLSLLLLLSTAHAEDIGKFTIMSENEPTPFEGVLFDPIATADILTARSFSKEECDLRVNYVVDTNEAEYQLELDTLNIRYKALTSEHDLMVGQKDLEIEQLQKSLSKHSPRNKVWLVIGGATVGVILGTAGTYKAYEAFSGE